LHSYSGIRELVIPDENLQRFYEDGEEYHFLTNEYIKVKNVGGEVIYLGRWDGGRTVQLKYKKIDSDYFGVISALNDEQKFLFNMLQDDSIIGKFCVGPYGCGKSFVSLCWALNEISSKRSRYNCIRFLRNEVVARDAPDIGHLPSTENEKLKPWAMEIADILGGEDMLDLYIEQGKIKLENIGFCRGRSWDRSIIFLEESQNITPYLLSLLMSRTGKSSCFIAVGDMRQADKEVFIKNSGINKAIEKLKGNPMFGLVTLNKNERSEFSSLADLLLE
jgi:PhoH-like ATPase